VLPNGVEVRCGKMVLQVVALRDDIRWVRELDVGKSRELSIADSARERVSDCQEYE
jgi:hypothetical protein